MGNRDPHRQARRNDPAVDVSNRYLMPTNRSRRRLAAINVPMSPHSVSITVIGEDVWLDVYGKAGIRFDLEEWGRFTLEACAALREAHGGRIPPDLKCT